MKSDSTLLQLECNIDDMNPEFYPFIVEGLLALGVRDVWLTPIIMKGGRPGQTIAVLLDEPLKQQALDFIFAQTTTLGVRWHAVERAELARESTMLETEFGSIAVKVGRSESGVVLNAAPEFRSCVAAAERSGAPLKDVFNAAAAQAQAIKLNRR